MSQYDCPCDDCRHEFIGKDLQHKFNYHGSEQIDPTTGYGERNVSWFRHKQLPDFLDLKDRLGLGPVLLDIGCASGYFTKEYARYFEFVHGVDFSHIRIELAQEINAADNIKYSQIDIVNYSEPAEAPKMDTAVSSAVYQHIDPLNDNRLNAFKNTRSLLKTGGYLVLYDEDYNMRSENWQGFYQPLEVSWLIENVSDIFQFQEKEFIALNNSKETIYRWVLKAI